MTRLRVGARQPRGTESGVIGPGRTARAEVVGLDGEHEQRVELLVRVDEAQQVARVALRQHLWLLSLSAAVWSEARRWDGQRAHI